MTVLFILATTQWDGSTFSCLTILKGLIGKHHSVSAIIPANNEKFILHLSKLGVKVHVVPVEFSQWPYGNRNSHKYIIRLLHFIKNRFIIFRQVCNVVKCVHPDIIHTNVSPIDVGYYAARIFKIPHIWHIREYCDRDFDIQLFPSKYLYHKKLKRSYSVSITKDLQSYHGLSKCKRSFVIYNGVRHKESISYIKEKEPYFLVASRVSKEKAQDRIICVFAEFCKSHPEYKLIILGRGDTSQYGDKCIRLAEQLGIKDNVIFEGFQSDVDSYLKKATALLVASPFEGFGRMTAEAAFNGCVVIGYDSSGTKEILETTGGYLWRTDEEFLKSMYEVASMSSDEYSKKAKKAQEAAKNVFSIESYIDGIMSVYHEILNNAK